MNRLPLWGESDKCDEYQDISESEAMALIDEQRERYNKLLGIAAELAKTRKAELFKRGERHLDRLKAVADAFENTEFKIVAFLYGVCEDTSLTLAELSDMGLTYRIVNSVRILIEKDKLTTELYYNRLRYDPSAGAVMTAYPEHKINEMRNSRTTDDNSLMLVKLQKAVDFLNSSEVMKDGFKLYE